MSDASKSDALFRRVTKMSHGRSVRAWQHQTDELMGTLEESMLNTQGLLRSSGSSELVRALVDASRQAAAAASRVLELSSTLAEGVTKCEAAAEAAAAAAAADAAAAAAQEEAAREDSGDEYSVQLTKSKVGGFGIGLKTHDDEDSGEEREYVRIEVDRVEVGGPAFEAGVQVGDELLAAVGVSVAGRGTEGLRDAMMRMQELEQGGQAEFEWTFRGGGEGANLEELNSMQRELEEALAEAKSDAQRDEVQAALDDVSREIAQLQEPGADEAADKGHDEQPRAEQREEEAAEEQGQGASDAGVAMLQLEPMEPTETSQSIEHSSADGVLLMGRGLHGLPTDPKIPRKHVGFSYTEDGEWVAQTMSKNSALIERAGGEVFKLEMQPGTTRVLDGDIIHFRKKNKGNTHAMLVSLTMASAAPVAAEEEVQEEQRSPEPVARRREEPKQAAAAADDEDEEPASKAAEKDSIHARLQRLREARARAGQSAAEGEAEETAEVPARDFDDAADARARARRLLELKREAAEKEAHQAAPSLPQRDADRDSTPNVRHFRAVRTIPLRAEADLQSAKVGKLESGDVIQVYEVVSIDDDLERVRSDRGWATVATRTGAALLVEVGAEDVDPDPEKDGAIASEIKRAAVESVKAEESRSNVPSFMRATAANAGKRSATSPARMRANSPARSQRASSPARSRASSPGRRVASPGRSRATSPARRGGR